MKIKFKEANMNNRLKVLLIAACYLFAVNSKTNSAEITERENQPSTPMVSSSSIIPCLSKEDGKALRLYRTNNAVSVTKSLGEETGVYQTPSNIERGGEITVITDDNAGGSYQLESDRFSIERGELLIVNYSINVENGKAWLGFLNTARNGWIGTPCILEVGLHNGAYKRYVELHDVTTSLVFRNAYAGQSKFMIKHIEIKKQLI